MNRSLATRVRELNADCERVTGNPVTHFLCPILLKDEQVDLCKAHVVNAAFGGRRWTVQRRDVDTFFGSMFEADFADIRYKNQPPDELLLDASASKRMRPRLVVGGRSIPHYLPSGSVPGDHTPFVALGKSGRTVRLAATLRPREMKELREEAWQLQVVKDLRIPALVSLLKIAHLTLFDLLGYQYAACGRCGPEHARQRAGGAHSGGQVRKPADKRREKHERQLGRPIPSLRSCWTFCSEHWRGPGSRAAARRPVPDRPPN